MRVVTVPCLKDNFAYLLVCEATGQAALIDPGEAEPMIAAVRREGVTPTAIWATHHHPDHVGGIKGVLAAFPGLEVVAHAHDHDRISGVTRTVVEADEIMLGNCRARIIFNPGHTLGAISYRVTVDGGAAVFTGDTMFAAGCGRLFEGTAAMMGTSLIRLAALSPETEVYFGHEYTESNLRFAAAVEPDSPAIAARIAKVAARRARGEATTPSTIADELATNPFVRSQQPAVIAAARTFDPSIAPDDAGAVFGALRRWKDVFKG